VPTLVVAGRYDGMTSGQERGIQAGIPGSELAIFEDSSHYPFAEERERFLATLWTVSSPARSARPVRSPSSRLPCGPSLG
jgi:hypothetical protein